MFQLAEVLNRRAQLRGHEKDQLILSLRKESVLANEIKLDEINRRCRLEAELKAIRVYVDYTQQKKGDRMRNKAVQTETSIPSKMNFEPLTPASPLKKVDLTASSSQSLGKTAQIKAYSNYRALEAATSARNAKTMEQEFQKQTKVMKHRFLTAASKSNEHGDVVTTSLNALGSTPAASQRRFSYPADQLTQLEEFSHSDKSINQLKCENSDQEGDTLNHPAFSSSPTSPVHLIKSNSAYYPQSNGPRSSAVLYH